MSALQMKTGRSMDRFILPGLLLAVLAPAASAQDLTAEQLQQVQSAEAQRIAVMARAAESTVCILDEDQAGGGSGVIIAEDGYGLTNFHVIAGMLRTRKGVGGLVDGKTYPIRVLGFDPTGDVAMFRMSGREKFTPAVLGDSDTVQVGDWVFALGNPFLLAEDYSPTATHGIVSGVHRYQFGADARSLVYTDCIQVDASINPGNSGGPLFNMAGQVVGINGRASFETRERGRVNVGLGYAISINQIKRFIPGLRAGRITEHGSLGATVVDLGYRRVVFEKMLEPSVAYAAGIEVGDRLVEFAGQPINSANQFANLLGVFPAYWPVQVVFERDGKRMARTVRLERLVLPRADDLTADKDANAAEAARVLRACRAALGKLPLPGKLRWMAQRSERVGNAMSIRLAVRVDESGSDRGRREVTDPQAGSRVVFDYNGRTVTVQADAGQPPAAPTGVSDPLNLWMIARSALYTPATEEADRWKHVGGDEYAGRVIDVLEYAPAEGSPVWIGIDPQTGYPVRVLWKPTDLPKRDQPPVEIELGRFVSFQGASLPREFRYFQQGELMATETVSAYEQGGN